MRRYWKNKWFKAGALIALVGWGPLLAIIFLAATGVLDDPNPNPIGPGLLFFVSFWPAVILMGIGAVSVWRQGR